MKKHVHGLSHVSLLYKQFFSHLFHENKIMCNLATKKHTHTDICFIAQQIQRVQRRKCEAGLAVI